MPKASFRLPERITLVWGCDRLEVDDHIWINKIVQELAPNGKPAEDDGLRLFDPRSRRLERMDAQLRGWGLGGIHFDPKAPPAQVGFHVPVQQGPVAAEALKVFLGLELPVALNFVGLGGRSEHRMSAVHTSFMLCRSYSMFEQLVLCWKFSGYQLYASHHIGEAQYRPYRTESLGNIERRLLSGQWVRWGFDGASIPPAGRRWSTSRRTFILNSSGIHRVGGDDFDLETEYNDLDDDDDNELPSLQEAK